MFPSRRITTMGGDVFRDEHSLAFDGTDDYIQLGEDFELNTFSVSAWVKTTTDSTAQIIIGTRSASDKGWICYLNSNEIPTFKNMNVTITSSETVALNKWYHLAFTFDGTSDNYGIYINGKQNTYTSSATVSVADCDPARIGVEAYNTSYDWFGNISEVAVYDAELTASQIATIYNGREPYNHKEGVASGNLQAWYRMGDGVLDNTDTKEGGIISDEADNTEIGVDLVDDVMNASNWSNFTGNNNTIALDSGAIKITWVDDADGGYVYLRDSKGLTTDLTVGKVYRVSFSAKVNTGSVSLNIYETGGFNVQGPSITSTSFESHSIYIVCTATQDHHFWADGMADGEIIWITDVKVQEISGNAGVVVNMDNNQFSGDTP